MMSQLGANVASCQGPSLLSQIDTRVAVTVLSHSLKVGGLPLTVLTARNTAYDSL